MKTKKCNRCHIIKDISQFSINKGRYDGLQSFCRECNSKYLKEHYKKNKKYYINKAAKLKDKTRRFVQNIKNESECKLCKENHPACLVFHHNDPNKKDIDVSRTVVSCWSTKRIKQEIKKCTILCANCHRKLHYEEKTKTSSSTG